MDPAEAYGSDEVYDFEDLPILRNLGITPSRKDDEELVAPELANLVVRGLDPNSKQLVFIPEYSLPEEIEENIFTRREKIGFTLSKTSRGISCCRANMQNFEALREEPSALLEKLGFKSTPVSIDNPILSPLPGIYRIGRRIYELKEDEKGFHLCRLGEASHYCGRFIHQVPDQVNALRRISIRNAGQDDFYDVA